MVGRRYEMEIRARRAAHLDAPLNVGPKGFVAAFDWLNADGTNGVRFCDKDVEFLRRAEEGPLNFSVYKSSYGPLRGKNGRCGLVKPERS